MIQGKAALVLKTLANLTTLLQRNVTRQASEVSQPSSEKWILFTTFRTIYIS